LHPYPISITVLMLSWLLVLGPLIPTILCTSRASELVAARRFDDAIRLVTEPMDLTSQPSIQDVEDIVRVYKMCVDSLRRSFQSLSTHQLPRELSEILTFEDRSILDRIAIDLVRVMELWIGRDADLKNQTYYHLIAGDFARYIVEVSTGQHKREMIALATLHYNEGLTIAETIGRLCSPMALRLRSSSALLVRQWDLLEATNFLKASVRAAEQDLLQLLRTQGSSQDLPVSRSILDLMKQNIGVWDRIQDEEKDDDWTFV